MTTVQQNYYAQQEGFIDKHSDWSSHCCKGQSISGTSQI